MDVGVFLLCLNINCGMFCEFIYVNLDLLKFVWFSFLYNRYVVVVIIMLLLLIYFYYVDGGCYFCMEKMYVYKRCWKCEKIIG